MPDGDPLHDRQDTRSTDRKPGDPTTWTRRQILAALSALGLGSTGLARAIAAAEATDIAVTDEMIAGTGWLTGLDLDASERTLMQGQLGELVGGFDAIRGLDIDNAVSPAVEFTPLAGGVATPQPVSDRDDGAAPIERRAGERPASDDDLAFLPLTELSALIRTGALTSRELTEVYLTRLDRHDPTLRCVISRTDDLAREQAARADDEIRRGRYRGPLHGIPWGCKDIISVPGYPTTWGAMPYRDQRRPETATVVDRLQNAGAVLVAKTSVGALAWGDVWFDATTKNPWKTDQGSSGSSAGSASATAAGLMGFALGTETWGSIVSPSTVCGVTGLRPTFGRVSRYGAMALSWSMDKIGAIARSAEDCGLVFDAIRGPDGHDTTVIEQPFFWPYTDDVRTLRIGVVRSLFDADRGAAIPDETGNADALRAEAREWADHDRRTLSTLERMGMTLVDVELPDGLPIDALSVILTCESSAAFDALTRSGRDDELVSQEEFAWPNFFRIGQMIPAVEYIRANRVRTMLMRRMAELMASIDVFVAPSWEGNHLLVTNLTGHPSVTVPNGFRSGDGTPTSITFTGRLFGETSLLAVAHAYQDATDFHLKRPPIDG